MITIEFFTSPLVLVLLLISLAIVAMRRFIWSLLIAAVWFITALTLRIEDFDFIRTAAIREGCVTANTWPMMLCFALAALLLWLGLRVRPTPRGGVNAQL